MVETLQLRSYANNFHKLILEINKYFKKLQLFSYESVAMAVGLLIGSTVYCYYFIFAWSK